MRLAFAFLVVLFSSLAAFTQSTPEEALTKAHDLYSQRKMMEAAGVLKSATKKFPDCARCYLELTGIYIQIRDGFAALNAVEGAIRVASTDDVRGTAHFYRGLLLYSGDKKQQSQAEKDFRDALSLNPKLTEAHLKLGVTLLREKHDDEGLAELRKYLEADGPKEEEIYAKKLLAHPGAANTPLAPNFTVPTIDGDQFSLVNNSGKIVVIDFWATWCPPCRASVPEIKELVKKYPKDSSWFLARVQTKTKKPGASLWLRKK
jgi:thioredoxin-like negative regulator of GroEL